MKSWTGLLSSQFGGHEASLPDQITHMTESEYAQLTEFKNLPLYDDDDPRCSGVDDPNEEDPNRTIWLAVVHEAEDLKTALANLRKDNLTPRGGIRYWDGDHKDFSIFVYFWEKR